MSTAALTLPSRRSSAAPDEGSPSQPLTATAPLGYAGGDANLYRYCGNGPTDGTDPSGLQFVLTGPEVPARQRLSQNAYWTTELWTGSEGGRGYKVRVVKPCTIVIEVRHYPAPWSSVPPLAVDPNNIPEGGTYGILSCWASLIFPNVNWPAYAGGSSGGIPNWPTIVGIIGNADPNNPAVQQRYRYWLNLVRTLGGSFIARDANGGLGLGDRGFAALMEAAKNAAIARARAMMKATSQISTDPNQRCPCCPSVTIVFHVDPDAYNWAAKAYADIASQITVFPDGTAKTTPINNTVFTEDPIAPIPPPARSAPDELP